MLLSFRPNLITLLGLLSIISAFTMISYSWMCSDGIIAPWLYVYTAMAIFIYQSLDAIDGKQARRTNTGGPLGQLFDHGCDAINIFLQAFMLPILFGSNNLVLSYCLMCTMLLAFYAATWEEYHTGTLLLGYISGPVEGQILSVMIILTVAIIGPTFLRNPITVPFTSNQISIPLNDLIIIFVLVATICTILGNIRNIYRLKGAQPISQLLPFLIFLTTIGIVVLKGNYGFKHWEISTFEGKLEYFLLSLAIGEAFANTVFRAICAHLCHQDFPRWIYGSMPLILAWVTEYLSRYTSKTFLIPRWILFLYSAHRNFYDYSGMVYTVINQFCDYLKVRCFTIPPTHATTKKDE